MDGLGAFTLILLAAFGLAAGVGITAIGPGGVLATIGLLLLTGLTPSGVAGTAIVTHVATGVLGSHAYYRSGQLRQRTTRRLALVLGAVAIVGTPLGVVCNQLVSAHVFGVLLAIAVAVAGVLVSVRRRSGGATDPQRHPPPPVVIGTIGLVVSVTAGLFGLGGPMLAVPLLVIVGTPLLAALGAAQLQSVVIASTGTVAYLAHGSIHWPLAALVGVPELAGVMLGHRLAHAVPTVWLTSALGLTLILLAPWLVLHG